MKAAGLDFNSRTLGMLMTRAEHMGQAGGCAKAHVAYTKEWIDWAKAEAQTDEGITGAQILKFKDELASHPKYKCWLDAGREIPDDIRSYKNWNNSKEFSTIRKAEAFYLAEQNKMRKLLQEAAAMVPEAKPVAKDVSVLGRVVGSGGKVYRAAATSARFAGKFVVVVGPAMFLVDLANGESVGTATFNAISPISVKDSKAIMDGTEDLTNTMQGELKQEIAAARLKNSCGPLGAPQQQCCTPLKEERLGK